MKSMGGIEIQVVGVSPPEKACVQPQADALGLCEGLRVDTSHGFRCSVCRIYKAGIGVWVPDGVSRFDAPETVTEICRLTTFNGSGSMWCLDCAPKKPKMRKSFFQKIAGVFSART